MPDLYYTVLKKQLGKSVGETRKQMYKKNEPEDEKESVRRRESKNEERAGRKLENGKNEERAGRGK